MICQGRLVTRLLPHLFFSSLLTLLSACGNHHSGWNSFPVPIYADTSLVDAADAESDLRDAMAFWETKAGRKLFDYRGTWNGQGNPYSGTPEEPGTIFANVIFFQNPWTFDQNIVGRTTVNSSDEGIQAGMIMINPHTRFCPGDCTYSILVSQRKTFAHELGHFLGLAHVQDVENIMYPDSTPGGSLESVRIDDGALREVIKVDD